MDWLGKIRDILSLDTRQLVIVATLAWALLLIPESLADLLGLGSLRDAYRPWIGAIALLATTGIAAGLGFDLVASVVPHMRSALLQRRRRSWLHNTTKNERHYLRHYIENETQTAVFDISDGVVRGLEAKGIVYQASIVGDILEGFAYNLQPWAYEYLRENPHLLENEETCGEKEKGISSHL